MLYSALILTYLMLAQSRLPAETLNPSNAQSVQFQEAPKEKTGRGPASVATTPEPILYREIDDQETEAGFCISCGGTSAVRSRTLSEQARDVLKAAERSANGK